MAINYDECEAYFKGEIRPLIFEVYTESGIAFNLAGGASAESAYCQLKDEAGELLTILPATIISDEETKKRFICSWDTSVCDVGYYRLQVWALVNVSNAVDANFNLVVEGKLASEEIIRYIKS